jgi:hypothetical protein
MWIRKGGFKRAWGRTCWSVHQIYYAPAFPHPLTPIITSSINALFRYFKTRWASLSDTPCPFSVLARQLFQAHHLSSRCAELQDSDFSIFLEESQATLHYNFTKKKLFFYNTLESATRNNRDTKKKNKIRQLGIFDTTNQHKYLLSS